MRSRRLLNLGLLGVALISSAAFGAPSAGLPPILKEVEAKYTAGKTLTAKFEQTNWVASLKRKQVSSGLIFVQRPDKFRWETASPDKNILVGDGKTYWFYTPPFDETEHGQLIIRKSSQIQSKLANALLSGSLSSMKDVKVMQDTPTQFVLTPKKGTAGDVVQTSIEIDLEKKLIKKVYLEHKDGNHTEITLSEIELGKKLDEGLFTFVTPKNTDIVK